MQKCGGADKYQAQYAPRCNRGRGCETCRMKWDSKQRARFRRDQRMASAVLEQHKRRAADGEK